MLMVMVKILRRIWEKRKWYKLSGLKLTIRRKKVQGIVFGKWGKFRRYVYSPTFREGSIGVFGGSGSGKTAGLLIPTLRAWTGAALVFDISGDIAKNVSNPLKVIFSPENANTAPYNPFAIIDILPDTNEQRERLMQLAFLLLPDSPQDGDVTMFYKSEARKLLQAGMIAYYFAGLDFCQVCQHMVKCDVDLLIEDIQASGNELAEILVSGFEGQNEKTLAGIKQTADDSIMLFATNEKIARTVRRAESGPALWPGTLERRSMYIVIDDVKLEFYAPLLRLITAQCLEYLSMRPNGASPNMLLCLDEFASLGKLEIIPTLRKLRKKNVRLMVLTQSLADLELIYGREERRAMMENLPYKAVLAAFDTETQKYFSDLAGEIETVRRTFTDNQDGGSESRTTQREKRIYPEEFAKLGDKLVLFYPAGVHKLRKAFYFKWW